MTGDPGEITRLLDRWQSGDKAALESLMTLVYDELRRLSRHYLRRERAGHSLLTTDLVHEAFIRLTADEQLQVNDGAHFLAIAARTMRRILVDHARLHQAQKRIGRDERVSLDDAPTLAADSTAQILEIHGAIEMLRQIHPRQAQIVELRYFGGLSNAELATVLEVSEPTVTRDWRVARLWLHRQLKE